MSAVADGAYTLDKLYEKVVIHEAAVHGAMDNIKQFDPNSPIIDGLYFSFDELKEVINIVKAETK